MATLAGLALLWFGCGDRKPAPAVPQPAVAGADASAEAAADAGTPAPLSEAECSAFVDHIVELGMSKLRAESESGKPLPTEAQLEDIRKQLGAELVAGCLALDRAVYRCAMHAQDAAAYAACAPD